MTNETTKSINDGDNRRRVTLHGSTIGWITKWHQRDKVNDTGVPRFSAKPLGVGIARHDCRTYASAVAYLVGYATA